MTFRSRPIIAPTALVLSLILSACGGGGGSTAPGATDAGSASLTPINLANFQTVAATVTAPVGELMNLNNTTNLLVAGVEVNEFPSSLASASTEIYKRFHAKGSRLVTGAVVTEPCTGGGSVSIDESTANSAAYTVGDRATLTFTNCKESNFPLLNGAATFRLTAVSGNPDTSTYNLSIAATFDNFALTDGTENLTIKGDMAIAASQNGTSTVNIGISGSSLAVTNRVSGTTTNTYALAPYSLSGTETNGVISMSGKYTLSGSSTKLSGSFTYSVETLQPLIMSSSSNFPRSGAVIVRGSPATVTVTALDASSVRIDYSDKGDGVVSSTKTLDWSAFDALK